jgi:hypothetical protein
LTTKNKITFFSRKLFSSCKLNEELGRTDEHSIPNTAFIYKKSVLKKHILKSLNHFNKKFQHIQYVSKTFNPISTTTYRIKPLFPILYKAVSFQKLAATSVTTSTSSPYSESFQTSTISISNKAETSLHQKTSLILHIIQ